MNEMLKFFNLLAYLALMILVVTFTSSHNKIFESRITPKQINQPFTEIPPDTEIEIKMKPQNGLSYIIHVLSDGSLTLKHRGFTSKGETIVKAKITKQQILEIMNEFQKADFFSFKEYFSRESDCPILGYDSPFKITTFTVNGKTKKVFHTYNCRDRNGQFFPRELSELESKIEEIINPYQWLPR